MCVSPIVKHGQTERDTMSSPGPDNRIIAFRASVVLNRAIEAAAAEDLCSISDIARRAIARDLRTRGLLTDLVATERAAHG
jgi:hypothetical protein